jgi:hypothetical protein
MEKEIKKFENFGENFTFNYGLIAVDPKQEGDHFDILHFCGYEEEPGKEEAKALREEFRTDPSFGLQEIWDKVDIMLASEEIVQEYQVLFQRDSDADEMV